MSETAIRPALASVQRQGRQSHFVHIETNRRIGAERALISLRCGPGGEHDAPGLFARLGGRRRKTDAAVSDRISRPSSFLWQESFVGSPTNLCVRLDLAIDSANKWLRSCRGGAVRGDERGLAMAGPAAGLAAAFAGLWPCAGRPAAGRQPAAGPDRDREDRCRAAGRRQQSEVKKGRQDDRPGSRPPSRAATGLVGRGRATAP